MSFNSTLVQLKGRISFLNSSKFFSFNSTLVQLKAMQELILNNHKQCFNSTLVQLKVFREHFHDYKFYPFQFYLSSIKSLFKFYL